MAWWIWAAQANVRNVCNSGISRLHFFPQNDDDPFISAFFFPSLFLFCLLVLVYLHLLRPQALLSILSQDLFPFPYSWILPLSHRVYLVLVVPLSLNSRRQT